MRELWLARSKTALLDIRLSGNSWPNLDKPDLLSYASRIHSLGMFIQFPYLSIIASDPHRPLFQLHFPALEHLSVEVGAEVWDIIPTQRFLPANVPNLTSLKLQLRVRLQPLPHMPNLTHLDLTLETKAFVLPNESISRIMEAVPSLQWLRLQSLFSPHFRSADHVAAQPSHHRARR